MNRGPVGRRIKAAIVAQNGRNNPSGSIGRRGHDAATRRIFLACSKGECGGPIQLLERRREFCATAVLNETLIEGGCASPSPVAPWQYALLMQATIDRGAHRIPNPIQSSQHFIERTPRRFVRKNDLIQLESMRCRRCKQLFG